MNSMALTSLKRSARIKLRRCDMKRAEKDREHLRILLPLTRPISSNGKTCNLTRSGSWRPSYGGAKEFWQLLNFAERNQGTSGKAGTIELGFGGGISAWRLVQ